MWLISVQQPTFTVKGRHQQIILRVIVWVKKAMVRSKTWHFWQYWYRKNCPYPKIASLLLYSYHTQKGNDFSVREGFKKNQLWKIPYRVLNPPPWLWKFFYFFQKLDHFLRTFCKKCIFTIENPKKLRKFFKKW